MQRSLAALLPLFICLNATARTFVSAMAWQEAAPSTEEDLVDSLAARAATLSPETAAVQPAAQAELQSVVPQADPQPSRAEYSPSRDYAVSMQSKLTSQQQLSGSEISVYVAIGVLTLIAVALIIAGAVFCYKYSAALQAADRNDPRQPIVFGSQSSGVGSAGAIAGDTKLAVHAQKSYYQRQKQNIASNFKQRSRSSKSPIQEVDSDQDDSNVYGCPGLASTSGLEVNNPIFAGPASDEE